ncbi:MAG: sialidase family protein [Planctomycetaceae bacterium]
MSRWLGLAPLLFVMAAAAAAADVVKTAVFTSGEEGYHTFRIPSLITTPNGTLLAICEGRKSSRADHGDIDLVLKRSTDGGKTWSALERIYEEGGDAAVTIGNPCPVIDQSTGTIWLPFTRDNDGVFVTHSTDDGRTWSTPVHITAAVKEPDWTWYATGPGVGIQLTLGPHTGRLVIPCDHRVPGPRDPKITGRSHVIYSDDHGRTWQLGEPTELAMNECQVVQRADGTLLLNMRSYRGRGCRAVSISDDGGETWSDCRDAPALIDPVCQASFLRDAPPGEDGSDKQRLLFSNPASTSSRHRLTVRMSLDDGRSWPISRLLHEGPAAYSCLTVLPDGDIGCLYEAGEKSPYETLTFARFSPAWLEAEPADP